MTYPQIELQRLEKAINSSTQNFTGAYMSLGALDTLIKEKPEIAQTNTIKALGCIIENKKFINQRQAFFLYKSAADILIFLLINNKNKLLKHQISDILKNIICSAQGYPHRAVAEAVASLPLNLSSPNLKQYFPEKLPCITWESIIKKQKIKIKNLPAANGRSLITSINNSKYILVVKLARQDDCLKSLSFESAWADYLYLKNQVFSQRFNIPKPLTIKGSYIFRLSKLPVKLSIQNLHPKNYAIGFIVHKQYFDYPNDHKKRLNEPYFKKVIFRNAKLMGQLASMGIVHTAPIPLFHNRVQQTRRADHGIYLWNRGGRLDQWLFSCRYPNFGITGIRDFEHLLSLKHSSQKLYQHIGTQLLSLLLVTGSYFRHKDISKTGLTDQGYPVDVRYMFDQVLLKELVYGIFLNYYSGFVGHNYKDNMPFDMDNLVLRMIDEMGVDNHMEEILRIADQNQMTDEEFITHLKTRGFRQSKIEKMQKGEKEIAMNTGPHLGGFNQRISLPELILFLETASAICIIHKYQQKGN